MASERTASARRTRPAAATLSGVEKGILLALFTVPLVLMGFKLSPLAGSDLVAHTVSLTSVPEELHSRVRYILFLPLGAVMVVFFRVTLGIRVLGPFRSILLAVALQIAGVGMGLLFLALVVGVVVMVRPSLRAMQLPYFGRVSVTLSTVAALMLVAVWASQWFDTVGLLRVAYFPVVVLCLTGDGFARVWYREGFRSAAWRGSTTVAVALLITGLSEITGFASTLMRFPELLVLEIGLVILTSRLLGFRLLEHLNPAPVKRKKRERGSRRPGSEASRHGGGRIAASRSELPARLLRRSET